MDGDRVIRLRDVARRVMRQTAPSGPEIPTSQIRIGAVQIEAKDPGSAKIRTAKIRPRVRRHGEGPHP